ncbi:MAG TPA: hypothetical protein VK427_16175 [Kofleriaceae bacterium]|nr:hypothetical protein [Kofleriaceae bacterium]
MNELVDASLRFPAVVFTIGLGIALVYWVFVLLGALDIDLLGGGDHGVGDALTGGGKAGAEAIKGVGSDHAHASDGVLAKLGLGVVPVTITISLVMLVGWTGSLLLVHNAGDVAWLRYAALPLVLVASILVSSVLVRPLAPVFRIREGKSNRAYVGHTCTITTAIVDENFGHAAVEDAGGTTLDIPVRCDQPGKFARGDKALIIEFDDARQAYLVEPSTSILPTGTSGDVS